MKLTTKSIVTTSVTVLAMGAGMAFADGDPTAAGMESAKTSVLAMIGLAVAAGFVLMGASLAPDVGLSLTKKWIKKGAK